MRANTLFELYTIVQMWARVEDLVVGTKPGGGGGGDEKANCNRACGCDCWWWQTCTFVIDGHTSSGCGSWWCEPCDGVCASGGGGGGGGGVE